MTPAPRRRATDTPPARPGMADALFTKTQQRVLGLLFGPTSQALGASEIIRAAGVGSGAVQRELARLEASGLITARRVGRHVRYQANRRAPVFGEIQALVLKTVALLDPIREALRPLTGDIRAAFVCGSIAPTGARRDVALVVVSDRLTSRDVIAALDAAGRTIGRSITATVCDVARFTAPSTPLDGFMAWVRAQPWTWVWRFDEPR
jgi:DNA-binding transcriptional ArsR family regulator